ncbi:MAG: DMT family transporter [Eubacteriales bacterium]|nr:DMT family transporter [Eubacteriales bacterium]
MIGFLIAILSGILMSVQGVFNTQVTKSSSVWTANAFVQFTAFLVCMAVWAAADRSSLLGVFKVEPKYMLLGGVMGAAITWTVIKSMEALGPAKAVLFIVVAQIAAAYLIELFGMFGTEKQPWEWRKAVGMGLAVAGIVIFKWK